MEQEKEKARIKFNGENLCLICHKCSTIIKTGADFTPEELDYALIKGTYLPPQYCDKCKSGIDKSSNSSS